MKDCHHSGSSESLTDQYKRMMEKGSNLPSEQRQRQRHLVDLYQAQPQPQLLDVKICAKSRTVIRGTLGRLHADLQHRTCTAVWK